MTDNARPHVHERVMSRPAPNDLKTLLEQEERDAGDGWLHRHWRLAVTLLPIVLAVVLLAIAAAFRGPQFAGMLIGKALLIFTVLGKFAIPMGQGGTGAFEMSVWELAAMVTYMDVSIATILVYSLPRVYRLGRMGATLEDLAEHGLYILERQRWLGRVTFVGVCAFVMFPLTGTGAIGGSIFGRLLGLSAPRTLMAIAAGAVLGSFGMAAFAAQVASAFPPDVRSSWQFKVLSAVAVGLMIAVVWWRGRKVARELRERRGKRANGAT